jgi:hypothetical protein
MAEKVRLKVNMILNGVVVKYGSEVEREQIPERWQKRRYIERVDDPPSGEANPTTPYAHPPQ